MKDNKMKIDRATYLALLNDLENLKNQANANTKKRRTAFESETRENINSSELEENFREADVIRNEIGLRYAILEKSEIVDFERNENQISINDIIDVDIMLPNGEIETETIKMVVMGTGHTNGIMEVTVNSPMGRAIINKEIGDICTYAVNGNEFRVKINSIRSIEEINDTQSVR